MVLPTEVTVDMRVQLPTTAVRPADHIILAECTPRPMQAFEGRDLPGRLAAIRALIDERVVCTASFGLEDQANTHAIFTQNLAIDVVTLDTGRLFLQTYDLWAETERRYGQRIRAHYPDQFQLEALIEHQGINGFRNSIDARHACCDVRKVEPLGRALAGAAVWITGLRPGQSQARGATPAAEVDKTYGLVKANPLFDWSREKMWPSTRASTMFRSIRFTKRAFFRSAVRSARARSSQVSRSAPAAGAGKPTMRRNAVCTNAPVVPRQRRLRLQRPWRRQRRGVDRVDAIRQGKDLLRGRALLPAAETLTKILFHYFHERIWSLVSWGRR